MAFRGSKRGITAPRMRFCDFFGFFFRFRGAHLAMLGVYVRPMTTQKTEKSNSLANADISVKRRFFVGTWCRSTSVKVVVSGGPKTENLILRKVKKDDRSSMSTNEANLTRRVCCPKTIFGRDTDVLGPFPTDGVVWGQIFEKRGL